MMRTRSRLSRAEVHPLLPLLTCYGLSGSLYRAEKKIAHSEVGCVIPSPKFRFLLQAICEQVSTQPGAKKLPYPVHLSCLLTDAKIPLTVTDKRNADAAKR